MKTQTPQFNSIKKVLILSTLFITSYLNAQETPWQSKPKGKNPWSTESSNLATQEKDNSKPVEPDTTEPKPIEPKDTLPKLEVEFKDEMYAAEKSSATIRYFNVNGSIFRLNTRDADYHKRLRHIGKSMHNANAALGVGIATAAVFNVLALPVNMIAAAIPTGHINYKIEDFIAKNPHATRREIKEIKKGISGKRFGKALAGVGIGIAVNFMAIAAISSSSEI